MAKSNRPTDNLFRVKSDELKIEGVHQYFINIEQEKHKFDRLCDLYIALDISQSVIFCSSKLKVDFLTERMKDMSFMVTFVHDDMSQSDKDTCMKEFRVGYTKVLITTDIWVGGIDVENVSLIISYDSPKNPEQYKHRVGHSGRHGLNRLAIILAKNEDIAILRHIEHYYSIRIDAILSIEALWSLNSLDCGWRI